MVNWCGVSMGRCVCPLLWALISGHGFVSAAFIAHFIHSLGFFGILWDLFGILRDSEAFAWLFHPISCLFSVFFLKGNLSLWAASPRWSKASQCFKFTKYWHYIKILTNVKYWINLQFWFNRSITQQNPHVKPTIFKRWINSHWIFPVHEADKIAFFISFFAQNWNIWRRISTPLWPLTPPVVSRDSLIL